MAPSWAGASPGSLWVGSLLHQGRSWMQGYSGQDLRLLAQASPLGSGTVSRRLSTAIAGVGAEKAGRGFYGSLKPRRSFQLG